MPTSHHPEQVEPLMEPPLQTSAAEGHVQQHIDRLEVEPQAECQLYKYGICNIITLCAS